MFNGFVGEYLILLGTYQTHWQWASWAALGVIFSACYLLWSYQRVFFGEITHEKNKTLPDISGRERCILITMAIVILWMGIGSSYFTHRTESLADRNRSGEPAAPLRRRNARDTSRNGDHASILAPGLVKKSPWKGAQSARCFPVQKTFIACCQKWSGADSAR